MSRENRRSCNYERNPCCSFGLLFADALSDVHIRARSFRPISLNAGTLKNRIIIFGGIKTLVEASQKWFLRQDSLKASRLVTRMRHYKLKNRNKRSSPFLIKIFVYYVSKENKDITLILKILYVSKFLRKYCKTTDCYDLIILENSARSPSTSRHEGLPRDVVEAELVGRKGSCSKYQPQCPLGLFDLIGVLAWSLKNRRKFTVPLSQSKQSNCIAVGNIVLVPVGNFRDSQRNSTLDGNMDRSRTLKTSAQWNREFNERNVSGCRCISTYTHVRAVNST